MTTPGTCPSPALGRGAVHSRSDPVPDGVPLPFGQGEQHMEHETGRRAVVAGVQSLRQGADVDALVVKLLDGLEALGEVPRQAVDTRDHHSIPWFEHPAEFRP